MKSQLLLATALTLSMTSALIAQDSTVLFVTNTADGGDGSLRAAIEAANSAAVPMNIIVQTDGDITIAETLNYTGTAPLFLAGTGQTVRATGNVTLLSVRNGADLTVSRLGFAGPGGFSIENRGDVDGPAGKGIAVAVPTDATGTVRLTLNDVAVRDVAGHGVHISDCSLADDCGGGSGGGGDGSAAGIDVLLTGVTIDNVGHGRFDADGFRADERGPGGINFRAHASQFSNVGADGVELDEGDAGDITAVVTQSSFTGNGNYCDPAVLNAFLPSPSEGEFDDGIIAADAVPPAVTNAPDNACIEREVDLYDSGFVEEFSFGLDLDDGIDLDEAGDGSIISTLYASDIIGNLDEGVDWDEEGPGDITATFVQTIAQSNTDDGFKLSEEDAGGVTGYALRATASENGGKGFVFEEEGTGDVTVVVHDTKTSGNDDSDDTGVEVVQEDDGAGSVTITGSDIADGVDAEGVNVN